MTIDIMEREIVVLALCVPVNTRTPVRIYYVSRVKTIPDEMKRKLVTTVC